MRILLIIATMFTLSACADHHNIKLNAKDNSCIFINGVKAKTKVNREGDDNGTTASGTLAPSITQ